MQTAKQIEEEAHQSWKDRQATCESETQTEILSERGGDSSSQHDGDIDDDVFSSSPHSSARSSMASGHSHHSNDDNSQKILTSPKVGEEAATAHEPEIMSRMPSTASYVPGDFDSMSHTPSKVLSRPPFRTPSSVRNLQMSSPAGSLFSAPRSTKRRTPTVSRLGTPTPHQPRTPTRLKPQKEYPLNLLQVNVLPLSWRYAHLMTAPAFPESLQRIRSSWNLLQEKICETVFERGVLLSHPQEDYETLEERLLEALELPVHPRARILRCGHYMGPADASSSDDEAGRSWDEKGTGHRKWCDICRHEVKLEEVGDLEPGEKRFRVKFFASNGLMSSGAWAAAWREMERVDVELEPLVEPQLRVDLEALSLMTRQETPEANEESFVDEDDDEPVEPVPRFASSEEEEAFLREENKRRSRAAEKEELLRRLAAEEEARQRRAEEEELRQKMAEEEEMREAMAAEEEARRQMEEEEARRKMQEEERMREMYGQAGTTERPRSSNSRRTSNINEESLPDLLLAAFRVAVQDKKNLAICALTVVVLLLALRPDMTTMNQGWRSEVVMVSMEEPEMINTAMQEMDVPAAATGTMEVFDDMAASVVMDPASMMETVAAIIEKGVEIPTEHLEVLVEPDTEIPVSNVEDKAEEVDLEIQANTDDAKVDQVFLPVETLVDQEVEIEEQQVHQAIVPPEVHVPVRCIVDKRKVAVPKPAAPKIEEPSMEEPDPETPVHEIPTFEEPQFEEPTVEEPEMQEQKIEPPKNEEPTMEKPNSEKVPVPTKKPIRSHVPCRTPKSLKVQVKPTSSETIIEETPTPPAVVDAEEDKEVREVQEPEAIPAPAFAPAFTEPEIDAFIPELVEEANQPEVVAVPECLEVDREQAPEAVAEEEQEEVVIQEDTEMIVEGQTKFESDTNVEEEIQTGAEEHYEDEIPNEDVIHTEDVLHIEVETNDMADLDAQTEIHANIATNCELESTSEPESNTETATIAEVEVETDVETEMSPEDLLPECTPEDLEAAEESFEALEPEISVESVIEEPVQELVQKLVEEPVQEEVAPVEPLVFEGPMPLEEEIDPDEDLPECSPEMYSEYYQDVENTIDNSTVKQETLHELFMEIISEEPITTQEPCRQSTKDQL